MAAPPWVSELGPPSPPAGLQRRGGQLFSSPIQTRKEDAAGVSSQADVSGEVQRRCRKETAEESSGGHADDMLTAAKQAADLRALLQRGRRLSLQDRQQSWRSSNSSAEVPSPSLQERAARGCDFEKPDPVPSPPDSFEDSPSQALWRRRREETRLSAGRRPESSKKFISCKSTSSSSSSSHSSGSSSGSGSSKSFIYNMASELRAEEVSAFARMTGGGGGG